MNTTTAILKNAFGQMYSFARKLTLGVAFATTVYAQTGTVNHERWNNVLGATVAQIPLGTAPSTTGTLTKLEIPANSGDNYGTRIRGYIIPSTSGSYTLRITGDNDCELWLSTNDNPANKSRIAFVSGWTNQYEWSKYASQTATARNLTAGVKYYVEILHKEDGGGDHVAVGWTGPGISTISVIGGSNIAPFITSPSSTNVALNKPATGSSQETGNVYANANDGNTSTRWAASGPSFPQHWRVDLGSNHSLTSAQIEWENTTTAYKYRIETSTDGNSWTTAVDKTNNSSQGNTTDNFNVSSARYVRIVCTGYSGTYAWASIREVRIFGTPSGGGGGGGDTQAPTAPGNVSSTNVGQTSLTLTWSASTDNVGVTGYVIYRNGSYLASTTSLSYNVTGLSCNTSYSFYVRAKDAAGNQSANSSTHSRTTSACSGGSSNCMAVGVNLTGDMTWISSGTPARVFKEGMNWSGVTNPFTADVWDPAFIADINSTKYTMIRFMDWMSTNWSSLEHWSQRTKPTDNNTGNACWQCKDIAIEYMINLCNRTNKHMWINVPHKATDDFVTNMATLIRNNLNSNLKVYVEYSNETWNSTFKFNYKPGQADYVVERGVALNLPPFSGCGDYCNYRKGQSFYVLRSLQIFRIFNNVFGSSASRLRKVMAFSGNEEVALSSMNNIIDNPTYNVHGIYPDVFAVAPYIGDNQPVGSNVVQFFKSEVDKALLPGGYVHKFKAVLDDYNNRHPNNKMKFTVYECNQHFAMGNNHQKNFFENPGSYEAIAYMLEKYKPYFDTYMQFVHVAHCQEGNCWGAKAYYGQPESQTHQWRALRDYMNNNSSCQTYREEAEVSANVSSGVGSQAVIYPNPSSDGSFTVALSADVTGTTAVKVYNTAGTLVYSASTQGHQLFISNLQGGVYYVQIATEDGSLSHQKIVVN